jgi:predicted kinase
MDSIRELVSGYSFNEKSELRLSSNKNDYVYTLFIQLLKERMSSDGPIIIDNLNIKIDDIKKIKDIADAGDYGFEIVNFDDLSLKELLEINSKRDENKRLSSEKIEFLYNYMKENEKHISPITDSSLMSKVDFLSEIFVKSIDLSVDLSQFNKINHIGDLQGTYTPLNDFFKKNPYSENEFYIFLGDYIDRGLENDQSVRFVLDNIDKPNMIFLKGNHEIHLSNLVNNKPVKSNGFKFKTLPQLYKAGMVMDDFKKIVDNLHDFFNYEYKGKKVFTSHAGLGAIPEFPLMVDPINYHKGFGGYSTDINSLFNANEMDSLQFYGHRNFNKTSYINPEDRSVSLESDVESGGYLSIATLDEEGVKLIKIPAKNLNKINDKMVNQPMIDKMRNHELIKEKVMTTKPWISSFNFTKQAFFDKNFKDEEVAKARGLFINNKTNEIIARGYDKFFNIGEMEETSLDSLENKFGGNIKLFKKENGFLGLCGYDSETDELVVASKSTIEHDFSGYFKKILDDTLSPEKMERLKHYLRTENAGAIFEVNDPINDPHIVEYETPHIVLLDVVKRELELKRLSYSKLSKFAKNIGFEVKKEAVHFDNYENFKKFFNSVSNDCPFDTAKKFEGYVVENEKNEMVKIKLPYYNFWKNMRGIKCRAEKEMGRIELELIKFEDKIITNDKIPKFRKEEMFLSINDRKDRLKENFVKSSLERAFFIKPEQYERSANFIQYMLDQEYDEFKKSDIIMLRESFLKVENSIPLVAVKNKINKKTLGIKNP